MAKHKKPPHDSADNADYTDENLTGQSTINDESGRETVHTKQEADGDSQIVNLEHKVNDLNDKYLRLYSEFDNYRRRVSKEKLEIGKTAGEDIISSLLPVMDDFDRAIVLFGDDIQTDPVKQGIILIFNKFRTTLNQKGLSEIQAMGIDFDTDYHEAVAHIPAPEPEFKGKVIDVTQKGYLLNDKVIRFAKVVVGS